MGPHTGENGFGHFCRNKSASSRGDDTPHKTIIWQNRVEVLAPLPFLIDCSQPFPTLS